MNTNTNLNANLYTGNTLNTPSTVLNTANNAGLNTANTAYSTTTTTAYNAASTANQAYNTAAGTAYGTGITTANTAYDVAANLKQAQGYVYTTTGAAGYVNPVQTQGYVNPISGQGHVNTNTNLNTNLYNNNVVPLTTTTVITQGSYAVKPAFTKGEQYHWNNPYGVAVPVIAFDPNCKKCHGSGASKSLLSSTMVPCTRCYTRQGYCKKCYGTGTNYRKGKHCTRCSDGKRVKDMEKIQKNNGRLSSSSSSSDKEKKRY